MNIIADNEKIKLVMDALKKSLSDLFKDSLVNIIIFGSYTNGTFNTESDLDVFVIIDKDEPALYDDLLLDISVDLSLKYDIVISAFLESYSNFNKFKTIKPLYSEIEKNGVEIYAA